MIDSQNKRRNAWGLGLLVYNLGLVPSGQVDVFERANVGGGYMGIRTRPEPTAEIIKIGKTFVLPGGSHDASAVYVEPIRALNGSLSAAAATDNQALTDNFGSDSYGYLTDIVVVCTATAAVAGTVEVKDAAGGTVLWRHKFTASPVVGQPIAFHFSVPPRSMEANGQFFVTTTGANVTWDVQCNGYKSVVIGGTVAA